MRTILGRLADLGVPQLFKLLTSSDAEGYLELDTPAGRATLAIRQGQVGGELPAPVLVACRARAGTFRFRPGAVAEQAEWVAVEDLVTAVEAAVGEAAGGEAPTGAQDPLADLRDSLTDIELPGGGARVAVVTADPRPYRAMELDWRARGWEVEVSHEPRWPDGPPPRALVVHLPTSVTMVGQEPAWLDLAHHAVSQTPQVPVLWVGGLSDPWLRHQAIMAGVSFVLPGPVGEVGETARWFREEVTALLERLVSGRPGAAAGGEAEAFRDFFLALHMDAAPADVRASLLRVTSGHFGAGLLLAVRDTGFESLGGFGLPSGRATRFPRGLAVLEDVVARCLPVTTDAAVAGLLAEALGVKGATVAIRLLPALSGQECVAVVAGAEARGEGTGVSGLVDLVARSGSLLGL